MMHWGMVAAGLVAGLGMSQALEDDLAGHGAELGSVVTVRWAEPARLILREVEVPYWRVGPLFREVRAYMADQGLSGALFLHLQDNPLLARGSLVRCEVGFFGDADHTPVAPYQAVQRRRGRVASMTITGRSVNARHDYKRIAQWLADRGYGAPNSFWEIYAQNGASNIGGVPTTRIEVAISDLPREGHAWRLPSATVGRDRAGRALGSSRPGIRSDRPADEVEKLHSSGAGAATEGLKSVRSLIESGQFVQIAHQALPDESKIPSHLRTWMGQMVLRVQALARASDRMTPTDAATVTALAEALGRRHKQITESLGSSPLERPVTALPVTVSDSGQVAQIMRDLDTVLGRLAHPVDDAGWVAGELGDILQRTQNLIWGQPGGKPSQGPE